MGRDGYIEPADLAEGVRSAGLAQTTTAGLAPDWQGIKLVRPKGAVKTK